jgi:hypothetical protein
MVKTGPATLKDIAALPGVGEARVKQYGAAFLKTLAENIPEETNGPELPL